MSKFLADHAPLPTAQIRRLNSELDFLHSVSGFREYVQTEDLRFNYHFDANSYADYTRE